MFFYRYRAGDIMYTSADKLAETIAYQQVSNIITKSNNIT